MQNLPSLLGALGGVLAGALIALAGGYGGVMVAGLPLFALCVALAFLIQWVVFIPSWLGRTEKLFDLTGSLTYVLISGLALAYGNQNARSVLLAILIVAWAVRLGGFLYARIHKDGHDPRFRPIRQHLPMFFMTWTLQGVWVTVTGAGAFAAMTSGHGEPLGLLAAIGGACWLVGFAMEVVADHQKRAFRADPDNRENFITSGLWAWSRHPNYFGEILLWVGIALIALPALQGWQLATLISPLWVWLLLTRISGVRMLEGRAERRWGHNPDYQRYRDATPVLIPLPPGMRGPSA